MLHFSGIIIWRAIDVRRKGSLPANDPATGLAFFQTLWHLLGLFVGVGHKTHWFWMFFGGCFTFGREKSKVSSTASAAQDCWRIKNSLPLGWANMVSIERSYHNDPSKHKHQTAIVVGTGHAHQAWPQRLPKALAIQEPGCSIRPLKIGLPKRNIVSQPPFFSGYVSFRGVCVCVWHRW